jgi:hypothetical protein
LKRSPLTCASILRKIRFLERVSASISKHLKDLLTAKAPGIAINLKPILGLSNEASRKEAMASRLTDEVQSHIVSNGKAECWELCDQVEHKLPRELRDMVYSFLLLREMMTVEKHDDVAAIPLAWFNTLLSINLQHLVNRDYIGTKTLKEIAEAWYGVTTFSIASYSLGPGHNRTDPAVVNDFLSRDRWGWGINVRQRVKHFRILADYTDYTGTSAAQLLPHLQQVATITSRKARIEIQFTSPYFLIFRNGWSNLGFLLQGFSAIVFPVIDGLVKREHCVVISLENQHRFEVKSDESTVATWTTEFRKVFLL